MVDMLDFGAVRVGPGYVARPLFDVVLLALAVVGNARNPVRIVGGNAAVPASPVLMHVIWERMRGIR